MDDLQHLIKLAIGASIVLLVFSLGMGTAPANATTFFRHLFRSPHYLLRATLAMNVVVPAIAVIAVAAFDLPQAVEVALLAMAVSPVPPILPGKQMKFGARSSYVFGLLVAVSVTAIVLAPLTISIVGRIFNREAHIDMVNIATLVGKTVLLPLAAGLLVRQLTGVSADRIADVISKLATALLVVGLLPVLYSAWPGISSLIGDGTVLLVTCVVVAAIAAGHWFGGPNEGDRTALGIASAMRHPGIAMAIASGNFPENKLIPAGILLYVLVAAIITTIYGKLRGRKHAEMAPESGTPASGPALHIHHPHRQNRS
jgi:BASS family bile acid:Na+ symporter